MAALVPSSLPYKERGLEKATTNSYELNFCSHILLPLFYYSILLKIEQWAEEF